MTRKPVELIYGNTPAMPHAICRQSRYRLTFDTCCPYYRLPIFCRAVTKGHSLILIIFQKRVESHVYVQIAEILFSPFRRFPPHRAQKFARALHKSDSHLFRIYIRIFFRQDVFLHLPECSGNLHSCRTSSHNQETEQFPSPGSILAYRATFKTIYYLIPRMRRLRDCLYSKSAFRKLIHAEVIICRTCRYDKAVILQSLITGHNPLRLQIYILDMTHVVSHILILLEFPSEWETDVGRRKT